tara:strand:- start:349 stop:519 length:171 start_codon:yes stop_codon:yes gene_type:complete
MAFDIQKRSLKKFKKNTWSRSMKSAPGTKKFVQKLGTPGARKIAKQYLIQEIREAH